MPQGTQTLVISAADSGQTVAAVLRAHLHLSWSQTRRLILERRVHVNGVPCLHAARRVQRGQKLEVRQERRTPAGDAGPRPVVRFADAHLVVVDKPSGLTTMRHPEEAAEFGRRARRYLPPTLADLLPGLLPRDRSGRPPRVRAVHRLDKETSGLVVFARTAEAESHLGRQFRAHTTGRRYLAVVRGRAKEGRIESHLVPDRGDARRGSTTEPGAGKRAVTNVRVLEDLGDYTLVECRLETGRTHQVRIHLGEAGTPICGERVYDRPVHGKPLPDASGAPRLALHAAFLGLEHPATGQHMTWDAPLPPDLRDWLAKLRAGSKKRREGEG